MNRFIGTSILPVMGSHQEILKIRVGFMSDQQCIEQAAEKFIRVFGATARDEAAEMADIRRDLDDIEGAIAWIRVMKAIDKLQKTAQPS